MVFWVSTEPRIALRTFRLIEDVIRSPFAGPGKPELLKNDKRGTRARSITTEHRLTHRIVEHRPCFVTARHHYR